MDGFREPHTPQAVQEQQDRTGLSWILQPQAATSLGELQGCPGSTPGPACGFPGKSTVLAHQALPPYLQNQSKITKSLSFTTGCPAQLSSLSHFCISSFAPEQRRGTAPRCSSLRHGPSHSFWVPTQVIPESMSCTRLATRPAPAPVQSSADKDDAHPAQHDAARILQCCSQLHKHALCDLKLVCGMSSTTSGARSVCPENGML